MKTKNFRFKTLFMILAGLFCGLQLLTAQNLIPNGDLSEWKKKAQMPKGIYVGGTNDHSFSKSWEMCGEKNAILATYTNSNNKQSRYFSTSMMKLEPGTYELTFKVKGDGWIRCVVLAASGALEGSRASTADTGKSFSKQPMGKTGKPHSIADWKTLKVTYTVTKAGKYDISIATNNFKKGNELMIADLSLVRK